MGDPTTYCAMIYVDGEEFMGVPHDAKGSMYYLFDQTVREVGGTVALFVWKPKYGVWFREHLRITASVSA